MNDKLKWHKKITAPLPAKKKRAKISDDHPQWEFIDSEMIKIGSLSHASIDMAKLQEAIVELLATESKDFRLIVHLLRTLQHGSKPQDIILAAQLLGTWVKHYWSIAWPDNLNLKRQLAKQIIQRFESATRYFTNQADQLQHQEASAAFLSLTQLLPESEQELITAFKQLHEAYQGSPSMPEPEPSSSLTPSSARSEKPAESAHPTSAETEPVLEINSHSDKAWRHTQLRMAEILCERYPDHPAGYALRRNAIWHTIHSAPQAKEDGRTLLAAFSGDRMADYQEKLASPDIALWQQVEQSVTLAPFWFDGHYLSACIAQKLGYPRAADAIRDELQFFLQRLPALRTLKFSDHSPFLSESTQQWLSQTTSGETEHVLAPVYSADAIDEAALWQCWQQQGLEAALKETDRQLAPLNPRGQFYGQLLSLRMLAKAGMQTLAQQGYQQLYALAQQITLPEWEPDLIAQLQQLQQQLNSEP